MPCIQKFTWGLLAASMTVAASINAQAIEITNPYVKSGPALTPMARPTYRTGRPTPTYNPKQIEIAPNRGAEKRLSGNHTLWCRDQYKSYRKRDNSYVPLGGGQRRPCSSPFNP